MFLTDDFLRGTLNSLEEGVITTDKDGKIYGMNPSAERLTGWSEGDVIAQPLEKIYHVVNEETGQPFENIVSRILREGKTIAFENNTILKKKNAEEIIISNNGSPIRNKEGEIIGSVLVFRDITEKYLLAKEKRELTNRLLLATKINGMGIWEWEISSNKLQWDEGMRSLFNASEFENESVEHIWMRSVHSEDKVRVFNELELAIAAQRDYSSEYRILLNDGTMKYIKASGIIEYNELNEAVRMVGVNWNITEQKLAEQHRERVTSDLIQRNKNMEQFSFIVSHNLRGPLANIMGFAELLKLNTLSYEESLDAMKNMATAAYKLDDVVKDLNEILQIKTQLLENKEQVNFQEIVDTIKLSIDNIIKYQEVDIQTEFNEVESIDSVKSYIHSIFYNLIYNSIKYKKPGKEIKIIIKSIKTANGLKLVFRDNGMGIDLEKYRDNIFGLYKRFHLNTEGKGMGLFMVKTQVETLGGSISVNSRVEQGTEFTIEF